jgi:hypothetical protein
VWVADCSKHLDQPSGCDPALEILDGVHQSNPVNPLETLKNPTALRALEPFGKHNQIVFIDFSLFLIG